MCMGHSHKQENPQNSEAKWSIHDILDKGEKRDRFWDFQREIGNSQGAEKSGKQILRKLRCNGTEGNVVNRFFMAPSLIHMCYSQHVKVIMIKFLSWNEAGFSIWIPLRRKGEIKSKQTNKNLFLSLLGFTWFQLEIFYIPGRHIPWRLIPNPHTLLNENPMFNPILIIFWVFSRLTAIEGGPQDSWGPGELRCSPYLIISLTSDKRYGTSLSQTHPIPLNV